MKNQHDLEHERGKLENHITAMEGDLHDLEDHIQSHSQISAIQEGRVNAAHARKKRR